jgi:hypothetical protein
MSVRAERRRGKGLRLLNCTAMEDEKANAAGTQEQQADGSRDVMELPSSGD